MYCQILPSLRGPAHHTLVSQRGAVVVVLGTSSTFAVKLWAHVFIRRSLTCTFSQKLSALIELYKTYFVSAS